MDYTTTPVELALPCGALEDSSPDFNGYLCMELSYRPSHCCAEALQQLALQLKDSIPRLSAIVSQSIVIAQSKLDCGLRTNLSFDQLLAIVVFTFDLGRATVAPTANFCWQFNEILRRRSAAELELWKEFLYYILAAMLALPLIAGTSSKGALLVYWGLPEEQGRTIRSHCMKGRTVHWLGFTSTTTDLAVAQQFARGSSTASGSTAPSTPSLSLLAAAAPPPSTEAGIVLRLLVRSGRDIGALSAVRQQREVLLHPNMAMIVTGGCFPGRLRAACTHACGRGCCRSSGLCCSLCGSGAGLAVAPHSRKSRSQHDSGEYPLHALGYRCASVGCILIFGVGALRLY